jgi:CubicO group peptidase (beta-lactamase class C family)
VDVQGFAARRFGPVRDCFAAVLAAQPGTGAAFAAWFDGEPVVDLWGGHADAARRRPWQAGSLVMPYSVSKPFAAVCALRLAEGGRLDLDAPVQRYWPEFRAPATVRHVLSHQAGVVLLDRPAPTEAFYDWDLLCGLLAEQQPAWPPGTAHGESALFYGHLVGELVRRIDGRSIGGFLREEVCGPAGLEFFFGLSPAQQAAAVELTGLGEDFLAAGAAGKPELYLRAVANPPGAHDAAVVNGARWRAAEIPAVNGHGTARAIAGFLPRAVVRPPARPGHAGRSDHPAGHRARPGVRRRQQLGAGFRHRRRWLGDGRAGRQLRRCLPGGRLHRRLRDRFGRRSRPRRGGGERPARLPGPAATQPLGPP